MVALKGSSATEEVQRDAKDITKAKGLHPVVAEIGVEFGYPTHTVTITKQ